MDHKAYNRKLVEHLFNLLETAQGDRWYIHYDLNFMEEKQGLERYMQPDGALVLNFHPVACRNFHIGDEFTTCNMSLDGSKQHLILPHNCIRGIVLELEEGTVLVPATPIMAVMMTPPAPPADLIDEPAVPETPDNVVSLFPKH
ncbi:hypothetical protein FDI21_gp300 [Pseudomonas phage Noxifer]|uniref:Stringent starvation protein B n=1 Tax=Pseudomonas phage Noxifer TaxID=2006684 RepID=A0A1Y0SV67_9CAUD|nr:hypothetical protein FDI21_gp300 [Pseudomonas phage Noxifer]ARV77411.1 hypothetical protein NOXIFER_246 [Pseudomonas phage Noxifer]